MDVDDRAMHGAIAELPKRIGQGLPSYEATPWPMQQKMKAKK